MDLTDQMKARLAQYAQQIQSAQAQGEAPPPDALHGILQAFSIPLGVAKDTASLGMDVGSSIGRMATGGGIAGSAALRDITGLPIGSQDMVDATKQAISNTPDNGPLSYLEALLNTNEAYASKHNLQTGLANAALDPTNLLTPGAEGAGLIDRAPLYAAEGPGALKLAEAYSNTVGSAAKAGLARELEAIKGVDVAKPTIKAFGNDWKGQLVGKFRNTGVQDNAFNAFMAKANNIPMSDVGAQLVSMADNVSNAAKAGTPASEVLPSRLGALLSNIGGDTVDASSMLGAGQLDSGKKVQSMSAGATALAQVAYGLTTPRASIPLLSVPLDAAIGFLRPGWNEFMGQMGHVQQTAFRAPAFEHGFGKYFEGQGLQDFNNFASKLSPAEETAIFNAVKTRMAGLEKGGENLAVYGKNASLAWISPQDIFNASGDAAKLKAMEASGASKAAMSKFLDASTGNQLANEWADVLAAATEAGSKFSKQVYGDFSKGGGALNNIIPFMGWVKQAYPRVFMAVAKDPTMAAQITMGLDHGEQYAKKNNLPDYLHAQIPIGSETPLVGAAASALLGGRKGTMYVDPLGLLSPVGAEAGNIGNIMDKSGKPVQKALDIASALGIPGPNPLINYALYAGGLTDKTPTGLSAYTGFENAAPNVGPQVPSILNGVLNAARKAGGNFGISDPYELAAAQRVFDETGKPLSDPSNRKYVVEIAQKQGVYQRAKSDLDAGGAFRGYMQFTDPFQVTAIADTAQKASNAKGDVKAQVDQALQASGYGQYAGQTPKQIGTVDPVTAQYVQQLYDVLNHQNPAANINDLPKATAQEKQDPRLTAWQYSHMYLNRISPTLYTEEEKKFKTTLGIYP